MAENFLTQLPKKTCKIIDEESIQYYTAIAFSEKFLSIFLRLELLYMQLINLLVNSFILWVFILWPSWSMHESG